MASKAVVWAIEWRDPMGNWRPRFINASGVTETLFQFHLTRSDARRELGRLLEVKPDTVANDYRVSRYVRQGGKG